MGSAQTAGAAWGASAQDWADLQEPVSTPLYEAVLDAIGVQAGTRLIDLGCGAGLALQLAGKRGATLAGLDASSELLRVARIRLPRADLRQGDIAELPYETGSFDAVTAFDSLQYVTDPVRALRQVKRVAIPGAPVAVAGWGDPQRCDARDLIAALVDLALPARGTAAPVDPFVLAVPGALEALVESAALTAERAFEVATRFQYPDLPTAVRAALSIGAAAAATSNAGLDAARQAATAALSPFVRSDGSVRLRNVMRVVMARP